MICGQKLHVGPKLSLLADRNLRRIQEHRAKIYKRSGAERDLRTVITIKRRLDCRAMARFPEQLAQQRCFAGDVGGIARVVTPK